MMQDMQGPFARDKSSLQGWGKVKIRVDLQRKGIEESAITAALSEIDSEAAENFKACPGKTKTTAE